MTTDDRTIQNARLFASNYAEAFLADGEKGDLELLKSTIDCAGRVSPVAAIDITAEIAQQASQYETKQAAQLQLFASRALLHFSDQQLKADALETISAAEMLANVKQMPEASRGLQAEARAKIVELSALPIMFREVGGKKVEVRGHDREKTFDRRGILYAHAVEEIMAGEAHPSKLKLSFLPRVVAVAPTAAVGHG